jgi:hypothetical protein
MGQQVAQRVVKRKGGSPAFCCINETENTLPFWIVDVVESESPTEPGSGFGGGKEYTTVGKSRGSSEFFYLEIDWQVSQHAVIQYGEVN